MSEYEFWFKKRNYMGEHLSERSKEICKKIINKWENTKYTTYQAKK